MDGAGLDFGQDLFYRALTLGEDALTAALYRVVPQARPAPPAPNGLLILGAIVVAVLLLKKG